MSLSENTAAKRSVAGPVPRQARLRRGQRSAGLQHGTTVELELHGFLLVDDCDCLSGRTGSSQRRITSATIRGGAAHPLRTHLPLDRVPKVY